MTDKEAPKATKTVAVGMGIDTPVPHALGANFFQLTATTQEVQLFIGSVNIAAVTLAQKMLNEGNDAPNISPQVSHHFVISPEAFARLAEGVNGILERRPDLRPQEETIEQS